MDKQTLFTLLYITLIIVVIATCIFVMVYLKSSGTECLIDPIQYYEGKTNKMCYCNNGWGNIVNDDVDIEIMENYLNK